MAEYNFVTTWIFDASIERVWKGIKTSESWSEWRPGVIAFEVLTPGYPNGLGKIGRTTWKSRRSRSLFSIAKSYESNILRL